MMNKYQFWVKFQQNNNDLIQIFSQIPVEMKSTSAKENMGWAKLLDLAVYHR